LSARSQLVNAPDRLADETSREVVNGSADRRLSARAYG
jgi:hypothetical protein